MKTINFQECEEILDRAIKAHAGKTGLNYNLAMLDLNKQDPSWFEMRSKVYRITDGGKKVVTIGGK